VFDSSPARWPLGTSGAETWLRVDPGSSQQIAIDCYLTASSCSAGMMQLCTGGCGATMSCQTAAAWVPALGSPFWVVLRAPPDLPGLVEVALRAL
jgi:hypothetical protein